MQNLDIAKKLLLWNAKNLTQSASLQRSDLTHFFADTFQIKANGRTYDVNHDAYFDFLNQFRSTIQSISYDLSDFIIDKEHVVIPMTAHIVRLHGGEEIFEAILILKFNLRLQITLWHEVYIQKS